MTSSQAAPAAIDGTLSAAQYTGIEAAIFAQLNTQRTHCGLSAFRENTILDAAAVAHAQHNADLDINEATETSTDAGYTGDTYQTRAEAQGMPSSITVTGYNTEYYAVDPTQTTVIGDGIANSLLAGVYNSVLAASLNTDIGLGDVTASSIVYSIGSLANAQAVTGTAPLTFPCQGTTGVNIGGRLDAAMAPGVGGPTWGAPIAITGTSPSDTITLQSGSITDPSNAVTTLNLVDSTTDTNHILSAYQAVAFPSLALSPNTTYSVSLTGTYNGQAFTKAFTFTTVNSSTF
ncbi:CAP domain-containing protein [Pararobbsia silviterrae]|uniref:CAP domain-containing protein n=1 Tax=Pararobbsia silviterrae TaxID=1792498 RepID=A0A494X9G4_9BURK|nr:CAP domain-containing protein [Pararobbsia silviterrae]RKP47158.1 CAP domain-containing protein [Pararobbsia silviterrae]